MCKKTKKQETNHLWRLLFLLGLEIIWLVSKKRLYHVQHSKYINNNLSCIIYIINRALDLRSRYSFRKLTKLEHFMKKKIHSLITLTGLSFGSKLQAKGFSNFWSSYFEVKIGKLARQIRLPQIMAWKIIQIFELQKTFCLSIFQSVFCMYVSLSASSTSILSVYLSVCQSILIFLYCAAICSYVCLFFCPSISLLCVCLSVCLSFWPSNFTKWNYFSQVNWLRFELSTFDISTSQLSMRFNFNKK